MGNRIHEKLFSLFAFIFVTIPVILPSCRRTEQRNSRSEERRHITDLFVVYYLESGYCMHSQKIASGLAVLHCYPVSRVNCEPDGLYDPAGLQYTSQERSSRYVSLIAKIKEDHPECDGAANLAMFDPAYFSDSADTIETYKSNNHYEVVSKCPDPGPQESDALATKGEYKFIVSPRGAVAIRAKTLGHDDCLSVLGINGNEIDLINDYLNGSRIVRTECTYGPSAFAADCTAEESDIAYPFDF